MRSAFPLASLICCLAATLVAAEPELLSVWNASQIQPAVRYLIRGTGDRNNPLRRPLREAFSGPALFFQFRLVYRTESIDQPAENDGEFFVLWLDSSEGTDFSTHSGNIPNLGLHVVGDQNRFMVRYSPPTSAFASQELVGDREFRLVGRLSKTNPGEMNPYDQLDLWIDPEADDLEAPAASAHSKKAISKVAWIGFSTGRKTESSDEIQVWDVKVAGSWEAILNLPPKTVAMQPPKPVRTVSFRKDVLPILKARCFACHAGDEPKAGSRLDVLDDVLNQVTPRLAAESKLFQLVASHDADKRMPPPDAGRPLSEAEAKVVHAWIDEGLEWDEGLLPTPIPQSEHWAFQPLRRPSVPNYENRAWGQNPIDAFIARRQEQVGTQPVSSAKPTTLRRRASLDLTGLPPQSNTEGLSWQAYLDSLLSTPAYGERWGRHWLDIARWAESNGHQHNRDRKFAWRYRDYVIESFSQDKPFDQFLTEQLAGDQLPYSDERLVATGFLAAARYSGNELDKDIQRNDILVDVANTTAQAFLGLTLECAQCHTHKFDPISIRDYYRFQAFFGRGQPNNVLFQSSTDGLEPAAAEREALFQRVKRRVIQSRRNRGYPEPILVTPTSVVSAMNKTERSQFNLLSRQLEDRPQTWSWFSPATASVSLLPAPHVMRWPLASDRESIARRETYLLLRGDPKSRGPVVQPGWPVVFGPTPPLSQQTRKALAEWMVSPENPLTARVWANRVWQWHFGKGLVETSGDFGTQGTPPTHPELLDWLASELVESGWSTTHLHRVILGSSTYQLASSDSVANKEVDPDNTTYWQWTPRRLEAEAIRDSVLSVAGLLKREQGGPSVPATDIERRSVYLRQKRDHLPQQQLLFDAPAAVASCARRTVSTVPLQPLYLLNSGFVQQASRQFAARVEQEVSSPHDQVALAIELALSRPAREPEIERGVDFLQTAELHDFCLVLLNLNEFVYLP